MSLGPYRYAEAKPGYRWHNHRGTEWVAIMWGDIPQTFWKIHDSAFVIRIGDRLHDSDEPCVGGSGHKPTRYWGDETALQRARTFLCAIPASFVGPAVPLVGYGEYGL